MSNISSKVMTLIRLPYKLAVPGQNLETGDKQDHYARTIFLGTRSPIHTVIF